MLSHTFWGRILAGNRSRGWISSILAINFTDKTDQKHGTFKWISPEPKLPATLICSALWASLLLPDPAGRLLLVSCHRCVCAASWFRRLRLQHLRSSPRLPPGEASRSQQLPCLFWKGSRGTKQLRLTGNTGCTSPPTSARQ